MYFILGGVAAVIIVALVGGLVSYSIRAQGRELNKKFVALGELKGKTYTEIKNEVGAENSISYTENGCLRKWVRPSYNITLLFDKDDVCLGVSSETSV
ncbi:MAG: hypothetical protein K2O81_00285 [Clostridia bacterium]|nr:hypothetical protein [Clostridia bacterium]